MLITFAKSWINPFSRDEDWILLILLATNHSERLMKIPELHMFVVE